MCLKDMKKKTKTQSELLNNTEKRCLQYSNALLKHTLNDKIERKLINKLQTDQLIWFRKWLSCLEFNE